MANNYDRHNQATNQFSKLFFFFILPKLILGGGLFYSLSILLLLPQIKTIWHLIIIGPTSILIYLIIFAVLGFFEKEDKNHLTKIRQLWGGGNLD